MSNDNRSGGYPTPEAYEAACAALHKHRERADRAEQAVTDGEGDDQ